MCAGPRTSHTQTVNDRGSVGGVSECGSSTVVVEPDRVYHSTGLGGIGGVDGGTGGVDGGS